ncbi:transcriptional activator spt7 [Aaosphaeria arxii CBS 175.79]|uniref:SAGA complex subunit Spt7 n=1 Tax=Aaosphaeria arxii CBS 175.79 TaxID=1450172 RepID=A0A6A5Y052_9PLEO|nr:transcriptional activator spt7 [Aaosphaeria arxii CBS 175.79]KAF2018447.1 transcriptional activator spt7 [Aaosphaeria arxii CBS 175.79]
MSLAPSLHRPSSRDRQHHARFPNHPSNAIRLRTPNPTLSDEAMPNGFNSNNPGDGTDAMAEEDPQAALFHEHYLRTEARLQAVLDGGSKHDLTDALEDVMMEASEDAPPAHDALPTITPKKPARTIDEDDYGDDDDDEADEEDDTHTSPLFAKSSSNGNAAVAPIQTPSLLMRSFSNKSGIDRTSTPTADQVKSSDDVRKKLQQDKKAAEDAAKRSFQTLFYTLEDDRNAMLEQQKLDELDRQVETEMSGQSNNAPTSGTPAAPQQGTLSTTNLGASSLTLKHLIARIDAQRDKVHASDTQLRSLISEVRKNRSKWANEERVGQEELYESMEKVLMELKAGEHAHPFLQRVNKREAPDYYTVIKQPMDIGTMMKKLKQLHYKSKKEFVDDLMLIWSNCLKYNADPSHFLRKKALYMRKETEKLVPLIPEIRIRDRAEVEAEERRMRNGDADADGAEDSEDEPIMASRGRKAPSKGTNKGGNNSRKAPPAGLESTPGPEAKPNGPSLNSAVSNFKNEFLRADSEMEGSVNGFSTPPGTLTPLGPNSILRNGAHGSQADVSEADGTAASVMGLALEGDDAELDDLEYKTWKQVTKKDRALIAAERNRLFRDDHLNVEEPAILRSRAGMRRWLRHRKHAIEDESADGATTATIDGKDGLQATGGETLAEGIEDEEERQIPDYYDPVCAIPDLNERLQWVEDSEGHVLQQVEEYMRVVPKGLFVSPESTLTKKMETNMRQMQETRKICAKIGIVKQMSLQSQMYQNQFQKYDPQPFSEADIDPMVVSDDGAIMAPYVCRAALERSVAKIFYHAGFEEFQPSALDSITDIASTFFQNLARTFQTYREQPKSKSDIPVPTASGGTTQWTTRFSQEESVLHALSTNGVELESLESYAKDDLRNLGVKLTSMHDRMRTHYAELLRPALDGSVGADGVGAFNDGSEQFVGGDFAEDIGEDFFGFRELGLDKEFGLSFSVPLHLLQNRMHNRFAAQNTSNVATTGALMPEPAKFEPVTSQYIGNQIGLVQEWFLSKLRDGNDDSLIEDDDLPPKQRFPKPRLPPTGKISSPRKRPLREQQQLARKKRKLDEENNENASNENASGLNGTSVKGIGKPIGKLKLEMPQKENQNVTEPEKEDGSAVGMISPESILAA